jgi:hypothetical protein
MTTETPRRKKWLDSLHDAAELASISLPEFVPTGMGTGRFQSPNGNRFVTFKRRLVSEEVAKLEGIEWTFWDEVDAIPVPRMTFRESSIPEPERVTAILHHLCDWLFQHGSSESLETTQTIGNMSPPSGAW